ncbi:MAG: CRISPR system precrRNA processing endoribonuclease RAMP protein Cas6 [Oscillospiraceae bacterium]|jgi:hypothetical protein|nr:CRISPR system precrRNA processing endoribonuclease RAMP protein Cas6 [Oscillospiraceae bacterium]
MTDTPFISCRTLLCTLPDGAGFPQNLGYLLYGALNAALPEDLTCILHAQERSPFSAHVRRRPEGMVWVMSGFGEAGQAILEAAAQVSAVTLPGGDTVMLRPEAAMQTVSEEAFCRRYLRDEAPRRVLPLRFVTPCAFKSGGAYENFPTPFHILQSLALTWDAVAQSYRLGDVETLHDLAEHACFSRYNLRSAGYKLKGTAIPAFLGELTLSLRGPEPLLRIVNLLCALAPFSGIGIKTALGMGGVD